MRSLFSSLLEIHKSMQASFLVLYNFPLISTGFALGFNAPIFDFVYLSLDSFDLIFPMRDFLLDSMCAWDWGFPCLFLDIVALVSQFLCPPRSAAARFSICSGDCCPVPLFFRDIEIFWQVSADRIAPLLFLCNYVRASLRIL